MVTKCLSLLLVIAIYCVSLTPSILAQNTQPTTDKKTEKIKAQVKKIVAGEKLTKKIKLNNGTTYLGSLSSANEETFAVQDKMGTSTTVKYSEVKSIDKKDVPTALKIGIGAGAAAFVIFILTIFHSH